MRNSTDPAFHREREREMIAHVERLLADDRLRIDTTRGRRPVTSLMRTVNKTDGGVELKRLMSEMNVPDRELQAKMPTGESIECTLSQSQWFFFKRAIGKLQVVCVSPVRALLAGEEPKPLTPADVNKMIARIAPTGGSIPTTVVLMSTSGFTLEAHEAAERRADRTLILVEPNDAGGWGVYGPSETKALVDLFDPEESQAKAERIRQYIGDNKVDLLGGGLAADRVAAKLQLPQQVVEAELKTFAKDTAGLTAKRLDGRVVLFRESAAPSPASGGFEMPFIDKVKSLFARKGDNEKKVAFLSERRTALSQQRDRMYEDLNDMEQKEARLRDEFKQSNSALAKRRITSQLLQFRKDIELERGDKE